MIVQLSSDELFRLRGARGARLEALSGALWVTEEGRPQDGCLPAGAQYVVQGNGLVLVGVEPGGSPGRFALAIAAAWRLVRARTASAWRALCTARELEGLSDAQLKDIGLARHEIPSAARDPYSFFRR